MTDDRSEFREARDAGLAKRHEQRLARATDYEAAQARADAAYGNQTGPAPQRAERDPDGLCVDCKSPQMAEHGINCRWYPPGGYRSLADVLESDPETEAAGEAFDKAMDDRPRGLPSYGIEAIYDATIPDEAVEAAWRSWNGLRVGDARDRLRTALEAALPHIRNHWRTLPDADDDSDTPWPSGLSADNPNLTHPESPKWTDLFGMDPDYDDTSEAEEMRKALETATRLGRALGRAEAAEEIADRIERRRLKRRARWFRSHRWPAEVEAYWSTGMWDAYGIARRYLREIGKAKP